MDRSSITGMPEPDQYPAVVELSGLDGDNGFRIVGASHSFFGCSVSGAGDVNGDGFADIIVGAYGDGPAGSSFVIFGKAGGFDASMTTAVDGANGFAVHGDQGESGSSVSAAGDLNGDGYGDVIIGADGVNRAYVVFGQAGTFDPHLNVSELDGSNGFLLEGGEADVSAVSSAGDVNGDGFDDVLVGGWRTDHYGANSGASYVVFGHAGGFDASVDLGALDGADGFAMFGPEWSQSGRELSSAGDINGDGFDDILIGAEGDDPYDSLAYDAAAYVVYGHAGGFDPVIALNDLDGTAGFAIRGTNQYDGNVFAVSSAGDVNGDGLADMIIGGDHTSERTGESFVVFGHRAGFGDGVDLDALNGKNGFAIIGGQAGEGSGYSVSSAGDVNGDGFDDLILGAPNRNSNGEESGSSYVVFGHAGGFDAVLDLDALDGSNGFRIDGKNAHDISGFSVSAAGDINHDGLADLLIGAEGVDDFSGASYVLLGQEAEGRLHLIGTKASQTLVGDAWNDFLFGSKGDDQLWGHAGDDRLHGGTGDDILRGGDGRDVLRGGEGHDSFVFESAFAGSFPDLIKDLSNDDIIDLSEIDADSLTAGNQAFHLVSDFTGHAGELRLRFSAGGDFTMVQGDTDGDGHADLEVKIRGDHHDFTSFLL